MKNIKLTLNIFLFYLDELFIKIKRILIFIKWDFQCSLMHLISQSSSIPFHKLLQGFISELKMQSS